MHTIARGTHTYTCLCKCGTWSLCFASQEYKHFDYHFKRFVCSIPTKYIQSNVANNSMAVICTRKQNHRNGSHTFYRNIMNTVVHIPLAQNQERKNTLTYAYTDGLQTQECDRLFLLLSGHLIKQFAVITWYHERTNKRLIDSECDIETSVFRSNGVSTAAT